MRKWIKTALLFVLTFSLMLTLFGCSSDTADESVNNDKEVLTPTPEPTIEPTPTPEPEEKMDWAIFATIGVDPVEAERIFTKLGFEMLTDLQQIGTSTVNYQLYPYGVDECPINIMVEQGEITQVAFRHLNVSKTAEDRWFDLDILPEKYYYSGDEDYFINSGGDIGLVMYDTYMYEGSFNIGTNWETRELFYFDN